MTSFLNSFFTPKSVAIFGATEKNPWARFVVNGLDALGFTGGIHLVNRRGGEVLGRKAVESALEIGEPVDCAFIMVPVATLEQTLHEMAEANIRNGIVVTSGFAEVDADGAAEQQRIMDLARSLGMTLMGPNSLGFVNLADRVALSAVPVQLPVLPDPKVGLVSQSGATAAVLSKMAHATNVSLTYAIATGNEGMVDVADVIEYLIDCPRTRAIGIFAETFRQPEKFIAAARRALIARKPIVLLKVGVGELAAQVAQAHTGALVGDNRVFDAVCRDLGVIRVDTMEQLLQTSNMLAHLGPLEKGGFAVASISGGACEMIADLGEAQGVPFATFTPETKARLKEILPAYATVHNPLDTTGGVLGKFQAFEDAIVAAGQDANVTLVAVCFDLPESAQTDNFGVGTFTHLANGIRRAGVPGFLLAQSYLTVQEYTRGILRESQMPHTAAGLGLAMSAVGAAFRWSEAVQRGAPELGTTTAAANTASARPANEREALDFLAGQGVPTIPALLATSAQQAAEFAAKLDAPAVLKILSADIAHKTEVGGVQLNVSASAAGAEFDAMMARVTAAKPEAAIEGVTISPMRGAGVELIVGIARDPTWGMVLAVGLGGVWVEILADADLSVLPVTPEKVETMLGRLKASRLLDGYRGQPAVDRRKVAEVVAAIGDAALALGPELISLEVNPLWVSGAQVECLDALMVWNDTTPD